MTDRNLLSGLLLAGVGLLVVLVLIPYGVVEPRRVKYAALAPSYYPRIIAIALTVLGAVVAIRALIARRAPTPADDRHPQAVLRTSLFLAILAVYAASVPWLGFIVASALALIGALVLAGERRVILIAPIALLLPFALYLFFLKAAGIPIPTGVLEPYLRWI